MNPYLQDAPIVIEPSTTATAAVIWLHGLGADGYDFSGMVEQLNLPKSHGIRFVFPHAPVQAVTINGGAKMRSWYDIRSTDFLNDVDTASINASSLQIAELIEQQIAQGVAATRIVLAGFSQGGLVALHCGLHFAPTLGGVLALSTYYPFKDYPFTGDAHDAGDKGVDKGVDKTNHHRATLPIEMMHGTFDNVIPLGIAQQTCKTLQANGCLVNWHEYPMAHQVCAAQISDITAWFKRVFNLNLTV